MRIFQFTKLNHDASRKQLLLAFAFVVFCVSTPVHMVVNGLSPIITLFSVIAGTLQAYQITRWAYSLPPGNRGPVMALWLVTFVLMVVHALNWAVQGSAYHAYGFLGNAVDTTIILMALVIFFRQQNKTQRVH